MKVYSPSEIAELIDIKESTLRKYCLLLEKSGISFQRNNRGQRWYNDNDVIMLRKFMTLRNNSDERYIELKDMIHKQNEQHELIKKYIEQNETIVHQQIERKTA